MKKSPLQPVRSEPAANEAASRAAAARAAPAEQSASAAAGEPLDAGADDAGADDAGADDANASDAADDDDGYDTDGFSDAELFGEGDEEGFESAEAEMSSAEAAGSEAPSARFEALVHARSEAAEARAFERLSELFAEQGLDEVLPLLTASAARALARPLLERGLRRLTPAAVQELGDAAASAAQRLVQSQGRRGVRALLALAAHVGRRAAARGLSVRELSEALARTAAHVAQQPALVRQLAGSARLAPAGNTRGAPGSKARRAQSGSARLAPAGDGARSATNLPALRRLRLQGPVEIVIYER